MTLSDSQFDEAFDQMARGSAHTVASLWRQQGVSVPVGTAERFGQVMAEFLRSRKAEPSEVLFNIGMTRVCELLELVEAELPGGKNDPGFVDLFGRKLREEKSESLVFNLIIREYRRLTRRINPQAHPTRCGSRVLRASRCRGAPVGVQFPVRWPLRFGLNW